MVARNTTPALPEPLLNSMRSISFAFIARYT